MARATGLEPPASGVTGRAKPLKRFAQEYFLAAERAQRTAKVSPAPASLNLPAIMAPADAVIVGMPAAAVPTTLQSRTSRHPMPETTLKTSRMLSLLPV